MGVASSGSAAVTEYLGKPVSSVRLTIEGRDTADPAIGQLVVTPIGQPLSMRQIRDSVVNLFSLGQFEDVRVDASLNAGAVVLRYELVPIHPITQIRFGGRAGEPGIDLGTLRRVLTDRFGATPTVGKTAEMTRVLTEALAQVGYRRASLTPSIQVFHAPEHATVTFTMEPGSRTLVGEVKIIGTPSLPPVQMLRRLGLSSGAPYLSDQLNARIENYTAERRRNGYYEAKITSAVTFSDDDRLANVTLTVTPGPHVRVVFAGDALPSDVRSDLVPVEREGSVDEDLLEDSTARIEENLHALGYRDAKAPHTRVPSGTELIVTFTITRGPQYRVSSLDVTGNAVVPTSEFENALRLRVGQPFGESRLDADATLIEELYRRRGYASARVQPSVEFERTANRVAQVPVRVRFEVFEGARTVVDAVRFDGNQDVAENALRTRLLLQPGAPYVQARLVADRDAILVAYRDLGYENAAVTAIPEFAPDNARVTILYAINEGRRVFINHVLIVGNVRTSDAAVERELQLKQGDPLSLSKLNDSQRRLLGLGLFRRVSIRELQHGDETTRDLLVTVEESPPNTIGYGFGGEGRLLPVAEENGVAVQRLQIAPRSFLEYSRRNLFGKPRSINLFASLSVPLNQTSASGGLPEYRFLGTYREPRLFDTAADGLLNGTVEQQIRSSFTFRRYIATAQVARRLKGGIFLTGAYQIQRTELLTVNVNDVSFPLVRQLFSLQPLRLSAFSASVIRDTRNDQANPNRGQYLSMSGQVDAEAIGSQVGFAKSFFRAQTFHRVPHAGGMVFAANASLGTATQFNNDVPIPEPERFFAGGDTTNRGFALDTLGVRHLPPNPYTDTIDQDGFPIGGDATVIVNGELRVPVRGGLSVVGFVDTGNVFQSVSQVNLGELRSAVGFGVRYQSPFGPLRVDLGFKTHVNQIACALSPGESAQTCFESRPALHISFGQAF